MAKILEEINKLPPIHEQIKDGKFPVGECHDYLPGKDETNSLNRVTSQEKKALDNSFEHMYKDFRRAAESHRQTRKWVKSWIKPGMKMIDIA